MTYEIIIDGKPHRLEVNKNEHGYACKLDGKDVTVDAVMSRPNVLSLIIDGRSYEVKRELTATDVHYWVKNARYDVELRDPRSLRSRRGAGADAAGPKKMTAPMPGKVVRVLVEEGAEVKTGQGVVVVEARKMQNELKSPKDGKIQKLVAKEGAAVNAGDVLAIVE